VNFEEIVGLYNEWTSCRNVYLRHRSAFCLVVTFTFDSNLESLSAMPTHMAQVSRLQNFRSATNRRTGFSSSGRILLSDNVGKPFFVPWKYFTDTIGVRKWHNVSWVLFTRNRWTTDGRTDGQPNGRPVNLMPHAAYCWPRRRHESATVYFDLMFVVF